MSQADFNDFWEIARHWRGRHSNPRKGKDGAEPAWHNVIAAGADPGQICIGARGYIKHIEQDNVDPRHVCQARTFLNGWRWEQYVELAIETEKREAEELLERRRNYWRYGQRDALQDQQPIVFEDFMQPEVVAAYEQGYRETKEQMESERPGLRVVR